MAVDQLMTYSGTSEVFDIITDTQLDYSLTPTNEAYVEFQESTDGGTTWVTTSTDILKSVDSGAVPGQAPNTQYRIQYFGGIGYLRVQFDSTP